MNRTEIRARAARSGRTRLISMTAGAHERALWIAPDEDLDDEFWATDADTGDDLRLRGWLWELHDDAEARAELAAEYGDWRE